MTRNLILIALLALSSAGASLAGQPAGGSYVIEKNTVDGGGATSSSGQTFEVTGTIGQPDANVQELGSGDYIANGGFWARLAVNEDLIFKDGYE